MRTPCFELKGTSFTLSVLYLHETDLDVLATELKKKIAQAPQFFVGAPLVINISAITDPTFDIKALKKVLNRLNLVVIGFTGANKTISQKIKRLGLASLKTGKEVVIPQTPRTTKIIKSNIRSGQQIYAANGDIVIFGNVGNGAEIIADGNVHIYGALRGKVMAGARGDRHAVVIAKKVDAELISIAGRYWLSETISQHCDKQGGCIRLINDNLEIETLPFEQMAMKG